MMPDELSLTKHVQILAPPPRVWRALTTPEELIEWYAPGCRWEIGKLAPGGSVRFYNTDTDVQTAVIEEAVEPQRLVLRWEADPSQPAWSIRNTFMLAPAGSGTNVTIHQAGYESLPPDAQSQWLEQDRGALASIAASLKNHLEGSAGLASRDAP